MQQLPDLLCYRYFGDCLITRDSDSVYRSIIKQVLGIQIILPDIIFAMTSRYFQTLDDLSKMRYIDKLSYGGEILPDPLDQEIRKNVFKLNNMKMWPKITFGDIYMYLVEKECTYTKSKFKNYKGLDCYNYFLSGKVRNIISYECIKLQVCILSCDVQASQTLKTIHNPWIVAKIDGVVISGHCTCMAGLGEVCSHVSALLLTIEAVIKEGLNNPSCTSVSCSWNNTAKQVAPVPVGEMNFNKKRRKKATVSTSTNNSSSQPTQHDYEMFLNAIKVYQPTAPIFSVLSDDEDTDTASECEKENTIIHVPDIIKMFQSINHKLPVTLTYSERTEILMKNIHMDKKIIEEVEKNTRNQRENQHWFKQRQGRLTASLFGRILKCKTGQEQLISKIMEAGCSFVNENIKWGLLNEEKAKKSFYNSQKDLHVNFILNETGFLIDEKFPFLGASPDGKVDCDCCPSAIVEVKCPSRGKNKKIWEFAALKNTFLSKDLTLKPSHVYYDQIHGQMDIWKVTRCYFVTYTNLDINVEVIEFDSNYWKPQKLKLISFYKQYILSKILSK